jgi:4-amino-4-deoxy-L-arabinose transferase-like glycosyltransferase
MKSNMYKHKWLLALFLLVLIIPARVAGIDKFATVDEPWWVISGSNFYYAITHQDFANTIYDYHPAVTTTWMVTAGMVSYFPEYRGLGQGYFDVRKPLFENFMREQGKDTLPLIRNSRLIQIGMLIVLALLSFFLLQMLVDEKVAFLAIALALNAPFFLGISRLINHEGLLAMFVLVALLGMQVYLNKDRKLIYVLVSGAAFGLAQLTKSSSIVLIALIGLMLFAGLFKRNHVSLAFKIWNAIKIFVIWFVAAIFVYVLLWPGMWVNPGRMLYEVFGNAFSYAFQGARLDVTGDLKPSSFNLLTGVGGITRYINLWLTSSTLISWLGLIFIPFIFISKDKSLKPAPIRSTAVYLVILAALFIVLFGIAKGRDSAYYILSSFVGLDMAAGIGWGYALLWAQKRWDVLNHAFALPLILTVLVAFQLGSSLVYYPYYFTYKNPLVKQGGVHGYGEGLDQAAGYLAQKPNAKELRVIAYAARGCFSYFFPGESNLLKIGLHEDGPPSVEGLETSDYLVLYPVRQNDKEDGSELMSVLQDIPPEKTIFIDEIEYARIYKIADLPKEIYNMLLMK